MTPGDREELVAILRRSHGGAHKDGPGLDEQVATLAAAWFEAAAALGRAPGDLFDWLLLLVRILDYGLSRQVSLDAATIRVVALLRRVSIQFSALDGEQMRRAVRAATAFWNVRQLHALEVELLLQERNVEHSRWLDVVLAVDSY